MARTIDPRLVEASLAWYLTRQYLLAPFFPRLGTQQLGQHPADGAEHEPSAAEDECGQAAVAEEPIVANELAYPAAQETASTELCGLEK